MAWRLQFGDQVPDIPFYRGLAGEMKRGTYQRDLRDNDFSFPKNGQIQNAEGKFIGPEKGAFGVILIPDIDMGEDKPFDRVKADGPEAYFSI